MTLIDKDDFHKKIREEYDRHKAFYDMYHHVERGGIVQGLSYASMILCKQPEIHDIDRAAIMRLCNEIEGIATEIQERTMKNSYYMAQTIINKVLVISAEITAPPKSNGDHIRQMTDEELADFLLESRSRCKMCKKHDEICEGAYHECWQGIDEWLKQEVSEDAGTD